MASKFRQDMPPPGGYGPIEWAKKAPRRGLGGYTLFALMGAVSAAAWTGYYFERRWRRKLDLEMSDARIALDPLLMAERHRAFLSQLRKNRDEEADLMKNVPGWEVGTFYGEPLYHNRAGDFPNVTQEEYFAHTRWADMFDRMYERRKH